MGACRACDLLEIAYIDGVTRSIDQRFGRSGPLKAWSDWCVDLTTFRRSIVRGHHFRTKSQPPYQQNLYFAAVIDISQSARPSSKPASCPESSVWLGRRSHNVKGQANSLVARICRYRRMRYVGGKQYESAWKRTYVSDAPGGRLTAWLAVFEFSEH